jgi:hypothetical protein
MVTKTFNPSGALTLNAEEVTSEKWFAETGFYKKIHPDGWTIEGEVHEDYYYWVNEFKAKHPKYGKVWGDFEEEVFADSEEGFKHFYKYHTPEEWDYADI